MTLCRSLAARDIDITLVATGGPLEGAKRRQVPEGVTLHHRQLKCEWMQPPLEDVAEAGRWLDDLVNETRPDVIHLNDFAHGGRDFGGRPRVVVAHSDVYSWHAAVLGRAPDATWQPYRAAVNDGLAGASVVVAPAQAVLDEMVPHFPALRDKPQQAIFNAVGIDVEPATDREPFILTAGRVWDEAKNVKRLATIAADLPWPVKVIGDVKHPDGGTVSFDGVELLGPRPHAEVLDLMQRAGLYVLPATYEPFGLSAAEAAWCGCPLVLGDIPTLREVWGDAATFVDPRDAAGLARKLIELFEAPAKRRLLASKARERGTHFTAATQAANYLSLFKSITN
jgi:glycosyltransferase involved in cell wall biosynthesis